MKVSSARAAGRSSRRVVRPGLIVPAFAAVVALAVAGCSAGGSVSTEGQAPIDSNPVTELIKPVVTPSAADGAVGVSPAQPVTVEVAGGTLETVTMVNTATNHVVAGELAPDRATWTTTEPLGYNNQYRIDSAANGLGGKTLSSTGFATSSPGNLTQAYVLPSENAVVGIGQPVAIQFDENIPDRQAAQDAITITTNPPVEGAFYWVNNREVRWRPQNYWAPGTAVNVDVKTYGVDLGDGLFGQRDVHSNFTIGDAIVATADDNTKQVTFERNGEVIMTMPTSMGKDDTPTPNGVYIIGDRFDHMVMDSSTYGVAVDSADGYRTPVDWATRMSYSGIFFHSAPWSVGQQGYSNTSHGCLNLSPANAKWVFDNTKRGDIVVVKNTVGPTLPGTDGLGDWNIPWETWKAGNAVT
ncbi:hypothetical protein DW322_17065 [Rhodococcus rhodnii]|uniref:L,D-TPase catalytic domain-containing protein n=1 Tax=Rhodococcus rhodnii TaxID=38312 RepID=A0A6P2CKA0_9NOCA|nr:Ig-like domain-containing protein [Rhodococcus rhodnii]TXG91596.1 hypothetical protein DW322_17065 [Rhodococcus rhodnii]